MAPVKAINTLVAIFFAPSIQMKIYFFQRDEQNQNQKRKKRRKKEKKKKIYIYIYIYIYFFKLLFVLLVNSHRTSVAKKWTFYFSDRGWFFRTFALRTNTSTNHNGCAERTSCPYATTTQTTTADKLISRVSQYQVLFDKEHTVYKDNYLRQHMAENHWSVGRCKWWVMLPYVDYVWMR